MLIRTVKDLLIISFMIRVLIISHPFILLLIQLWIWTKNLPLIIQNNKVYTVHKHVHGLAPQPRILHTKIAKLDLNDFCKGPYIWFNAVTRLSGGSWNSFKVSSDIWNSWIKEPCPSLTESQEKMAEHLRTWWSIYSRQVYLSTLLPFLSVESERQRWGRPLISMSVMPQWKASSVAWEMERGSSVRWLDTLQQRTGQKSYKSLITESSMLKHELHINFCMRVCELFHYEQIKHIYSP